MTRARSAHRAAMSDDDAARMPRREANDGRLEVKPVENDEAKGRRPPGHVDSLESPSSGTSLPLEETTLRLPGLVDLVLEEDRDSVEPRERR